MSDKQVDPHIALVVEDDPHVRELAAALLEETRLDKLGLMWSRSRAPKRPWIACRSAGVRWR